MGSSKGLYQQSVDQFDKLCSDNRLFYDGEDSKPEIVIDQGFEMHFSLIKSFTQKPWSGKPSTLSKPDPFGQPEPDFVVASTPTHLLQLNKFCAMRPQFVLHPISPAPQTDRLNTDDFTALVHFLDSFRREGASTVAFYNCCPESGSSQPYKHMQIVPKPAEEEFVLFPERPAMRELMRGAAGRALAPPEELCVPFHCRVASIVGMAEPEQVHRVYVEMLSDLESVVGTGVAAHNLVMTDEWLCVVPRRKAGSPCAANSMGVMGILWLSSEEERRGWTERGMVRHLADVGYPVAAASTS